MLLELLKQVNGGIRVSSSGFLFLLDVLANVFSDTIVVPTKTCVTLFFVGVVAVFTRKISTSFFALIPLVDSSSKTW